MPSTFYGLTIAGSGLNSFQTAVNTTANNIANVQTEGYTRQVANRKQAESLRVYARYGTTGKWCYHNFHNTDQRCLLRCEILGK